MFCNHAEEYCGDVVGRRLYFLYVLVSFCLETVALSPTCLLQVVYFYKLTSTLSGSLTSGIWKHLLV